MRRELASKYLVRLLFLLAADARLACIFPASREIWLSETGSLETASSSGESDANLNNTRRNGDRQAGRGYRSKAAKTALSPFI